MPPHRSCGNHAASMTSARRWQTTRWREARRTTSQSCSPSTASLQRWLCDRRAVTRRGLPSFHNRPGELTEHLHDSLVDAGEAFFLRVLLGHPARRRPAPDRLLRAAIDEVDDDRTLFV